MKPTWLALLGLLFASCASGGNGLNLGGPPRNFEKYPAHNSEGIVNAGAKFAYPADQKELFLTNVLDDVWVIPVELRVKLRGENAEDAQVRLTPDTMNLRLYLQNGVALENVDVETFMDDLSKKAGLKVRSEKFNGGLLDHVQDTSGYLYFAIRPKERFKLDGDKLIYTENGIQRTLDIDKSLLAFDVIVEDHAQPFYVGILP